MTCSTARALQMDPLRYLLLSLLSGINVCGGDPVVVVGLAGHSATLPCVYDTERTGGPRRACWGRGGAPTSRCYNPILSTHPRRETPAESGRYGLLGSARDGDVSLTIVDLRSGDAGLYGCRVRVSGLCNDLLVLVQLEVKEEELTPFTYETTASDVPGSKTNQEEVQIFPSIGNIVRMASLVFTNVVVILLLYFKWKVIARTHTSVQTSQDYDDVQILE